MDTELSQPGAEPEIPSTTESYSVSAFTAKHSPLKLQHGIVSPVPVQSYFKETGEFPLLFLPLELRREIYRHYFIFTTTEHTSIYHLIQTDRSCNVHCLRKCRTSILTVNRQIYAEARDSLYNNTIWHISFNSLHRPGSSNSASDAALQAFRSQPEFQFIRHITVGLMFNTRMTISVWKSEDSDRLKINRELMDYIVEALLHAPSLLTLKLLWHDRIEHGDWGEKRDCLTALATLPETVKCMVFMGAESGIVHPRQGVQDYKSIFADGQKSLSAQEAAAKADLNRHLQTVRQQHQARSRFESPNGLQNTSPSIIEQSSVQFNLL